MNLEHKPNKHLTYEERNFIEIGLNQGRNFTEIGNDLNKSRTTIMREVKNIDLGKRQVDLIILGIYVRIGMSAKNLTVLIKKNAMRKKYAAS